MEAIYNAISAEGFSKRTVDIIDNYIQQIVNGKRDLTQFNQAEHGGLCCAGETLIGAYIVCDYAKSSLAAGEDVGAGQVASPASWRIDAEQEKLVEQWAKAREGKTQVFPSLVLRNKTGAGGIYLTNVWRSKNLDLYLHKEIIKAIKQCLLFLKYSDFVFSFTLMNIFRFMFI